MKILLSQEVQIFAGFSFRGKVRPVVGGDLAVIQLKDLKDDYTSIGGPLTYVSSHNVKDRYFLKEGDVLFISKGANNKALVYNLGLPVAVASNTFFILRSDRSVIDPGYLSWYLNLPPTQALLKQNLTGTYTLNLNRSALEQLEITLPELHRQKQIAAVDELLRKEKKLANRLLEKHQLYVQALLTNSINKQ